jgi:transcriptional regulator with XRE-family HTH domain
VARKNPLSEPLEVTQFVTEVGQRIRLMRRARRLTQSDLAMRADVSRLTVIAVEAGALSTRFSDVARLLWALDDQSLQAALADAAQDAAYQEAARDQLLGGKARRGKVHDAQGAGFSLGTRCRRAADTDTGR